MEFNNFAIQRKKSPSSSVHGANPFEYHQQKVTQYVYNVLDFSSQYGRESSKSYSVINLISGPSVYPNYGDHMESCVLVR